MLNQAELDALQWKGELVDLHEPTSTVRPRNNTYKGETIALPFTNDRLRSILGESPSGSP